MPLREQYAAVQFENRSDARLQHPLQQFRRVLRLPETRT